MAHTTCYTPHPVTPQRHMPIGATHQCRTILWLPACMPTLTLRCMRVQGPASTQHWSCSTVSPAPGRQNGWAPGSSRRASCGCQCPVQMPWASMLQRTAAAAVGDATVRMDTLTGAGLCCQRGPQCQVWHQCSVLMLAAPHRVCDWRCCTSAPPKDASMGSTHSMTPLALALRGQGLAAASSGLGGPSWRCYALHCRPTVVLHSISPSPQAATALLQRC
jgi:hypothetical protein